MSKTSTAAAAARTATPVPADVAATVAQATPPPRAAANAQFDEPFAYCATRKHLAAATLELLGDHIQSLDRMEYLLCSLRHAGSEDGAWVECLCDIGATWAAKQRERVEWYLSNVAQPIDTLVSREEGDA